MSFIGDIDSIDRKYGMGNSESSIRVENLPNQNTILKTKSIDLPRETGQANLEPQSLVGRVEKEADLSLEDQLLRMDPESLRAIEQELVKGQNDPPEPYYQIALQQAIEKMLDLHIKMSKEESSRKNDQKGKYTKSNKEWGVYQKELGDRGLNFTWVALGLMASQFLLPEADREFVSFLSKEGCTNLASMFNAETQTRQRLVEAVAQLALAEINAMMNKGSSDSSSKQEILNLLEKLYELLKRAAQTG